MCSTFMPEYFYSGTVSTLCFLFTLAPEQSILCFSLLISHLKKASGKEIWSICVENYLSGTQGLRRTPFYANTRALFRGTKRLAVTRPQLSFLQPLCRRKAPSEWTLASVFSSCSNTHRFFLFSCLLVKSPPDLDAGDFEYDVFLTYCRKDFSWVDKELLPLFNHNQVKYCVDFIHFELGKAFLQSMVEGIYKSRKVLAVWSANYASSKYCKQELDYALQRSFEKSDTAVIIIRIDWTDPTRLPKTLRTKTFLDYYDSAERKGWEKRLIRHLKPPKQPKKMIVSIVWEQSVRDRTLHYSEIAERNGWETTLTRHLKPPKPMVVSTVWEPFVGELTLHYSDSAERKEWETLALTLEEIYKN